MSYSYNTRKKALRTMRKIATMKREAVEELQESKHIRDVKMVEFVNANLDKINDYRKVYELIPLNQFTGGNFGQ